MLLENLKEKKNASKFILFVNKSKQKITKTDVDFNIKVCPKNVN